MLNTNLLNLYLEDSDNVSPVDITCLKFTTETLEQGVKYMHQNDAKCFSC